MSFKSINPDTLSIPERHRYLLGGVGPRPIAFASTIDTRGNVNLAPFSFFNVFSSNPPILVFSPARSGRTGETKDTLKNVLEVNEVVINVVTYNMVHQMSLASSPYERGVNEFKKAGFTEISSEVIQPPRVKESPIQFECKVNEVIELGSEGAAGNMVICEVVKIHIDHSVLNADGNIDQTKIDLVSRMGGNWYCRANGDSLFEVDKPITTRGVGIDALPKKIRLNESLNGNELGILGNLIELPSMDSITSILSSLDKPELSIDLAKSLIQKGEHTLAYAVLTEIL